MRINKTENFDNTITLTINLTSTEFHNNFCQCADCGKVMFLSDEDDYTYIDDEYYCDECTFSCDICGEVRPNRERRLCEDSMNYVCDYCYSHEAYVCDHCHSHFRYEDSLTFCNDQYLCEDCYDQVNVLDDYHDFKNYGYITFLGNEERSEAPYMGYELEVDANHYIDLAPIVNDIRTLMPSKSCYHFEHDGSLYNGMEMISQPCSLNYHLSLIDATNACFERVLQGGLRSHNAGTCGMHVHIDRKFFGKKENSAIAKLLFIFERFRSELMVFSRRREEDANSWARSRKDGIITPDKNWITKTVKSAKKDGTHQDRYYAVNLNNPDTIEIRLWRGTLNLQTFKATLIFTDRLARLAKEARSSDIAKMTFDELLGDDETVRAYWNRVSTSRQQRGEQ